MEYIDLTIVEKVFDSAEHYLLFHMIAYHAVNEKDYTMEDYMDWCVLIFMQGVTDPHYITSHFQPILQ